MKLNTPWPLTQNKLHTHTCKCCPSHLDLYVSATSALIYTPRCCRSTMIVAPCRWAGSESVLCISECGKALASAEVHLLLDWVEVTPLVWCPEREDYLKAALSMLFLRKKKTHLSHSILPTFVAMQSSCLLMLRNQSLIAPAENSRPDADSQFSLLLSSFSSLCQLT